MEGRVGWHDSPSNYLLSSHKINVDIPDTGDFPDNLVNFAESGVTTMLRAVREHSGAAAALLIEKGAERDGRIIASVGNNFADATILSAIDSQPANVLRRRRREEMLQAGIVWQASILGDVAICPLHSSAESNLVLACFYAHPGCPDRDEMAVALEAQLPFLHGCASLLHEFKAARHLSAELAAALDLNGCATILADAQGTILFTNAAANQLLEQGGGLRRTGRKLTAANMRDAIRLTLAIEHLTQNDDRKVQTAGNSRQAVLLSVEGEDGDRQIVMVTAPDPSHYLANAVVVQTMCHDADLGRLVVPVCKLYGLSITETELVRLLVTGVTVTEAAKAKRIKIYTARSYLKQIFDKTGTCRQADLVRLMLSCVFQTHGRISTEVIN